MRRSFLVVAAHGVLLSLLVFVGRSGAAQPSPELAIPAIGLFEGIESGAVEAKLILKDSSGGSVTIANKSAGPLTIKLPEAFAGVPVLAQRGGAAGGLGGGGGGGNNNNNNNNTNQGFGGGMMGMGGMGMMGGMGRMGMGGMFNVPAEKTIKLKVIGVCLDHGKKEPSPHVAYELKPIDTLAKDPQLVELVKMIARGQVSQHAGQAAAWHLANGLSWDYLARKVGVKHLSGQTEPYFTPTEIALALRAAQEALRRAERAGMPGAQRSPGQ